MNIDAISRDEVKKIIDERIRFAAQRAQRGWDERAYWDTGMWLCKTLGDVLAYVAEHLHGYPPTVGENEWKEQHETAAKALQTWGKSNGNAFTDEEREQYNAAQDALRWVADNLANLWD